LSVYADASFLVSLFASDAHTHKAEAFASAGHAITYSTWTRAEFYAAIGTRLRQAKPGQRATLLAAEDVFERWSGRAAPAIGASGDDIAHAERLVRSRALKLRAPDALHLAVVLRAATELVTFDQGMASAATALGVVVHAP
jgi:hypothetical protein